MSLRVSVCLNAGPQKGHAQCSLVAPPSTEAILTAAANKLRLKKKEVGRARLFVWRTGYELPRNGEVEQGRVRNDDLLAITLGEPYAGPCKVEPTAAAASEPGASSADSGDAVVALDAPPLISGSDDSGLAYGSLQALWAEQARRHEEYAAANTAWWDADGYGGASDDEAMIGDGGSGEDIEHSQRLLDAVRAAHPQLLMRSALDVGAGVGRVSKGVLLRRCERVALLEPCERWLKQARRYLGNKRAQRCTFLCTALQDFAAAPPAATYDVVWVQWTLQYLVDAHVVAALRGLAASLTAYGVLVLKENRPSAHSHGGGGATQAGQAGRAGQAGQAGKEAKEGGEGRGEHGEQGEGGEAEQRAKREATFQVDTPAGPHARYDVTRPDAHHRWLFRCAGLEVQDWEHWGETTAWVLGPTDAAKAEATRLEQPTLVLPPPLEPAAQ